MVDPISIVLGVLEFLLNLLVGFLMDFLLEFLWDLLQELLNELIGAFDLVALAAIALLVLGVIGTVVPMLPGPLLSIAGVLVYWVGTGFSDPGIGWVLAFLVLGLAAVFVDWFGGAISARIGGASTGTALAAALVGIVLAVVGLGPIGFLLGVMGTVFAMEYYRHEDGERAAKAAVVTFSGMLGSAVAQVVITGAMLVLMVAFVLV